MPSKEKLEVTPTKASLIIRLVAYVLLMFPQIVLFVKIGIEEAENGSKSGMAAWFFVTVLLVAVLICDFVEGIIGYFHRHLVLTEKECYYINVFGRKREFQLDEITYSVRYFKNGYRITLRDEKGQIIASMAGGGSCSLNNVGKISHFIDEHGKYGKLHRK